MPNVIPHSLTLMSIAASMEGDSASAARTLEEARAAAEGLEDVTATISLLQARCLNGLFLGDPRGVGEAAAEGVRLARETGDSYALEMMLMNQAYAALLDEEVDASKPLFAEALGISQRIDDRIALYALLYAQACLAARAGQARLAAQLLGAAESVRTTAGARVIGFLPNLLARAEETARGELGQQKFEAEFNAGKALSRTGAIALAVGESPRGAAPTRAGQGVLGKREAEVAQLIAEGLSNKQIGTRLFISERTVATHVGSILNKLGFNSRAQVAAWISSGDL